MKPSIGTRAAALAVIAASGLGLAACQRSLTAGMPTATSKSPAVNPDASAQTLGLAAAPPSGDPPGTTPVDSDTKAISKEAESRTMPHEGDNHAYSSVAADNPQKAGGSDPQAAGNGRSPQ
jgi:hypothetical protein